MKSNVWFLLNWRYFSCYTYILTVEMNQYNKFNQETFDSYWICHIDKWYFYRIFWTKEIDEKTSECVDENLWQTRGINHSDKIADTDYNYQKIRNIDNIKIIWKLYTKQNYHRRDYKGLHEITWIIKDCQHKGLHENLKRRQKDKQWDYKWLPLITSIAAVNSDCEAYIIITEILLVIRKIVTKDNKTCRYSSISFPLPTTRDWPLDRVTPNCY